MKKTITFDLPPYLTVGQYQKMNSYKGDSQFKKLITLVSAVTKYDEDEVGTWDLDSLRTIASKFQELSDPDNEFHSLIEWNGQLYGYAHMDKATLGEMADLETLAKDMEVNLHKIGALLYRPVTEHNFDSLSYAVKQKLKMVNNNVENVFDWYTVEKYDNKKRKKREEGFKDFPIHILLGAIGFFLVTVNLYLTTTLSSQQSISKTKQKLTMDTLLSSLSQSIGAGGGLSTTSLSPEYLRLQETRKSPMSTT